VFETRILFFSGTLARMRDYKKEGPKTISPWPLLSKEGLYMLSFIRGPACRQAGTQRGIDNSFLNKKRVRPKPHPL